MPKYNVLESFELDGASTEVGQTVELSEAYAAELGSKVELVIVGGDLNLSEPLPPGEVTVAEESASDEAMVNAPAPEEPSQLDNSGEDVAPADASDVPPVPANEPVPAVEAPVPPASEEPKAPEEKKPWAGNHTV